MIEELDFLHSGYLKANPELSAMNTVPKQCD